MLIQPYRLPRSSKTSSWIPHGLPQKGDGHVRLRIYTYTVKYLIYYMTRISIGGDLCTNQRSDGDEEQGTAGGTCQIQCYLHASMACCSKIVRSMLRHHVAARSNVSCSWPALPVFSAQRLVKRSQVQSKDQVLGVLTCLLGLRRLDICTWLTGILL